MPNALYYGDNLDVLRREIRDETVDLIYLDPPFNSAADYNVLFKAPGGHHSPAQVRAFEDTWHWTEDSETAFDEVMHGDNDRASELLRALRSCLGENDMMAYLAMMAVRLIELHRVLKRTGSLYLHCDPTASHYLKVLLDAVFGPHRFRNEIIWKRTSAHSSAKRWGPVHDVLLFASKGDSFTWNSIFQPYSASYVDAFYVHQDADGRRWRRSDLTGAGIRNGETGNDWRGLNVTGKGRHWAYPPKILDKMDSEGKIHWPEKAGGMPMLKRYLDKQQGQPIQDVIDDIPPMHNLAAERLGYPTQKPLALLERIIKVSSNEGDILLDPFCGCGTAIHAAQGLRRQWVGIDVTHLAIGLIERRLHEAFGMRAQFDVHGTPSDLDGARDLARRDKHEFQLWAVAKIGGVAFRGGKKGADGGIDGMIYFKPDGRTTERAVISVKGGDNVNVSMIRDLAHVVDRERAKVGVFVTLAEPSKPMKTEAYKAGFYETEHGRHLKIQIITVAELMAGNRPDLPLVDTSAFRKAREHQYEQSRLLV